MFLKSEVFTSYEVRYFNASRINFHGSWMQIQNSNEQIFYPGCAQRFLACSLFLFLLFFVVVVVVFIFVFVIIVVLVAVVVVVVVVVVEQIFYPGCAQRFLACLLL